jgi:hypothetical protein
MEDRGIRVRSARIGNWDPYVAIEAELAAEHYEAVVISTLPPGVSRWLHMDVQCRIARRHPGIRTVHVVARSAPSKSAGHTPR